MDYKDDDVDLEELDQELAPGMDFEEFQGIVAGAVDSAVDYVDAELSQERAYATDYYHGRPFGDEEEGRSTVVSRDVRDTVQQIMPSLMRIFTSADRVVEYIPRQPEDEAAAQQATDYVNFIMENDNNGFHELYSAFKDALIRKTGTIKVTYDNNEDVKVEHYTGLTNDALTMLTSNEDVEIEDIDEVEQEGTMEPLFDVTIKRRIQDGRVRIQAVPPEELIFNRDARTVEDAEIIGHRRMVTRSELVAMGYDQEDIDELGAGDDDELNTNPESFARNPDTRYPKDTNSDPSLDRFLYIEAYMRVDYDQDGIAELRRVCVGGTGKKILHHEPVDAAPFALFCPDPEPHTLIGTSTAELVMDIQRIKSAVLRNTLDSLAMSIHPRMAVVEGQTNIDDVLNSEVGGIIRQRAPGMVQPLAMPFVGQQAFPMMEYLDSLKESRTGVTRAAAGLNPDALQSTTRAAVDATIQAAQAQIELIARIFAETGMKRLFKLLLKTITVHQDKERIVRLRNTWVPIDPQYWNAEMDVRVNVALGTGGIDQKMQMLSQILGKQEQLLQMLGPDNPLCGIQEYRNTLVKMVELGGFKNPNAFFKDPAQQPPQPPKQPEPEKPDPAMLLAQAEMAKVQAEVQRMQLENQLKIEELKRKDDRERDKDEADVMLRAAEIRAKYGTQVDIAKIRADMDRDREAMNIQYNQQPQQGVPNG